MIRKVCRGEEAREIDKRASEEYGIDSLLLMEDAGAAVSAVVGREYGWNSRIAVVAGVGNNGGDALAAARRLYAAGAEVRVVIVGDPSRYSEPARRNYEIVLKMGIPVSHVGGSSDLPALEEALEWCTVAVVGLIGIGLRGEVKGLYRETIELINKRGKPVVSVDIPSGVDPDSGRVMGAAVKSAVTVTFGLPKLGNILYPGFHYCGRLYVSPLSYPPQLLKSDEIKVELNTPLRLPERLRWGHKGTFGKLLTVAGARYYYGAPYYVAASFLKAGGGYSRLAAPKSVVPYIAAKCSEVVYIPLEETPESTIAYSNLERLIELVEEQGIDVVAAGPGVSLNEETQQLIRDLAAALRVPVIIDGDGITAVARDPSSVKGRGAPTIITPHLIEFCRLTGLKPDEVQADPVGSLQEACRDLNAYIVLKGAHTLIGCPDGRAYINMTGNPGMAKAGSGDVLTGTIAAMYGIGFRDPEHAVRMGVLVHGLAGDLAAQELGEDGVTPDDVLSHLPAAVRTLREAPELIERKYFPEIV